MNLFDYLWNVIQLPVYLMLLLGTIGTMFINTLFLRPIPLSTYYVKDIFGNIYADTTSGCFDVCFGNTYSPLRVSNKKLFKVLTISFPFSFGSRIISSEYAIDTKQVFFRNKRIAEADPESFRAIGYQLGKDKNRYFLYEFPLERYLTENIDPSNTITQEPFEVIAYDPSTYIIIKQKDAYYSVKLNPQPTSITQISADSAKTYSPIEN